MYSSTYIFGQPSDAGVFSQVITCNITTTNLTILDNGLFNSVSCSDFLCNNARVAQTLVASNATLSNLSLCNALPIGMVQSGAFSSNAAVFGSNAGSFGSNGIDFSSNAAVWGSNTAVFGSNAGWFGSNGVGFSSNASVWSSNAAVFGSNAGSFGSNGIGFSSNAAVWASNAAVFGSNAGWFGSNGIGFSSNTAAWSSNAAAAASNRAYNITSGASSLWSSNAATVFIIGSNVGIGTNAPATTLSVAGTSRLASTVNNGFLVNTSYTAGVNGWTSIGNFLQTAATTGENSYILVGTANSTYNSTVVGFRNNAVSSSTNYASLSLNGQATPPLVVTGTGRVGVGTLSPGYVLDVAGNINFSSGSLRSNGNIVSFTGGNSVWSPSGTNAYITGSNVGIGTTSPANTLSVAGTSRFASTVNNAFNAVTSYSAGANGWTSIANFTQTTAVAGEKSYVSVGVTDTVNNSGVFGFHNAGTGLATNYAHMSVAGQTTPPLVVTGAGRVGIKTSTPSEALGV